MRATIAAVLLFAVLSLALTYPLPLHVADAVEDRQDALLNVWITAWDGHQLLTSPLHLFDANIFYPYRRTLAYSELLLGNALLALPVTAATGNPVLGYNIALLLSFFLSGLGAYLLVVKLTRQAGAGLVAGIVFAFSAYRMTNLAQAQLLTTQWLPLTLLALHRLRERPAPRYAAAFVLFFWLQAVSSFYYGILLALVVAGYGLLEIGHWAWTHLRSRAGAGRQPSAAVGPALPSRPAAGLLLAACCLSFLLLLPFVLPYFRVQDELGFERSLSESEPFSASLQQYALVPPQSAVHGRWLPSDDRPRAGGYPVDALFPGLLALVLAAWGLVRSRDPARRAYALLLVAAFFLSLGPRLQLAPGVTAGIGVPLPYAWLYAVLPGFKALRAPVRFDALVMLALAVLAGHGLAAILKPVSEVQQHGRGLPARIGAWRGGVAGLAVALAVGESLVWPAAGIAHVPVGPDVPPVYAWLAGRPATPILELPMAFTQGGPQLEYQYLSVYHWQPTPDGYSGFIPPKHGQIAYEMEHFPSERSVSLLQALGVAYVVAHTGRYDESRQEALWANLPVSLSRNVSLVETFGEDWVYHISPGTREPPDLKISAYLPPAAIAGQPYTAYVIAVNRSRRSFALAPTGLLQPTVRWEAIGGGSAEAGRTRADVPLVTSPNGGAAVIPVPLSAPRRPGTYRLILSEEGGVLGEKGWRAEGMIEVGNASTADFPVPARLSAGEMAPRVRPGELLAVRLIWHALGKIDSYYSVYVKLVDAQGNAITGWDGQPKEGAAPTLLWAPGDTIEDVVTLPIPADAAPGEYRVEAGMYRAEDLARCLLLDPEGGPVDRVVLGTVRVE